MRQQRWLAIRVVATSTIFAISSASACEATNMSAFSEADAWVAENYGPSL